MTPMQAIQAATSSAADLLGHSDLIRPIEPGRSADMVAVDKNPQPSQDFLVLASASIATPFAAIRTHRLTVLSSTTEVRSRLNPDTERILTHETQQS